MRGAVLFVQHQHDCPPGHVGERVAQLGHDADVVAAEAGRFPDPRDYDLVIPLGSGNAVYDESIPYLEAERALVRTALEHDVPVLGICFGAQLLAAELGATVEPLPTGAEIGWLTVQATEPELVDAGPWLVWHLDRIGEPREATVIARSDVSVQAFRSGPHLGVQFHPEALPASVRSWARDYSGSLSALGIDADALLAQISDRHERSRRRAHRLFDRFCERAAGHLLGAGTATGS